MESNNNPFNIGFGEEPHYNIERENEFNAIKSVLTSDIPESKAMVITGPRGSGKTVLLSKVKKYFDNENKWITVDLNPFSNMLEELAAKIYDLGKLRKLFLKHEFDFSFSGISFSISGNNPITNVNSLLDIMLKYLKSKNIRVLIVIDDIASSDNVKSFIYSFQSFLREGYNTFLVVTGLYENISKLENSNNLTFLLRTKKIFLEKLNIRTITNLYENVFNISIDDALKLSKLTMGYAYGFQLLGNIMYKNKTNKISKEILSEYDILLEDNVYQKIWSSITEKEKLILYTMIEHSSIKDILIETGLNNSSIQVYKKRLCNQGLIDVSVRGKMSFALPRFKEFVSFQKKLSED